MADARFIGKIYTTCWYPDLIMHGILDVRMHRGTRLFLAGVVSALPLLAVLMTSCATAQATSQDDGISDVYTAVALTVSAASATVLPTTTLAAPSSATAVPSTSTALPTSTPTSGVQYAYSSGCNNAAYLSDVTVADGEEMAPGEIFTKTWELLNTGNCSWSSSYSVVFVDGADMSATSADLDTTVAVGTSGDVSVELTAPEDEGTHTAYWRLADPGGTLFGEQFFVQIVVSGDAPTVTPTPTTAIATASATATSAPPPTTAIATASATATSTPPPITATARASATATSTPTVESATSTIEPTATTEVTPTSTGMDSFRTEASHDRRSRRS